MRRDGRQRIYSLNPQPLKELYDWVHHYQQFWHDKLRALGAHLDRKAGGGGKSRRKRRGKQKR